MSRLPEQPKLPGGMQSPVCEPCFARGQEARFMEVLVGRSFDDDFGMIQHRCRNCGWMTPQSPIPLYVMAASNLEQLEQILAAHEIADPGGIGGLSPGAVEIVESYGINPYILAEAAARFAIAHAQGLERIGELIERVTELERDAEQ